MPASERIARLLVVPLAVLFAFLLLRGSGGSDDDPVRTSSGEDPGTSSTTSDAGGSDGTLTTAAAPTSTTASTSTTSTSTSTTTTTAAPTTTVAAGGLTAADPGAPPVEPVGVYRDGAVELRGSVPDEATADAYVRRLGAVLGDVTSSLTLDRRTSGDELRIEVDRSFGSPVGATFDPGFGSLASLAETLLDRFPEATLVLTGHTDAVGTEATDRALSVASARLAVEHLVDLGVPAQRVTATGAGHSQPVGPNDTPAGRAANRRITAAFEGITPDGR
jgi:outer membrane protein OmpA-like peptidoglycan-associated protein